MEQIYTSNAETASKAIFFAGNVILHKTLSKRTVVASRYNERGELKYGLYNGTYDQYCRERNPLLSWVYEEEIYHIITPDKEANRRWTSI